MNNNVDINIKNKILKSINNNSKVIIKYLSSKNEVSERLISDLKFTDEFDKFGYYGEHIKAYCHLRNDERHFKIDRILSFKIIDDDCTIGAITVTALEEATIPTNIKHPLPQEKVVLSEPERKAPKPPPIIRTNTHKNNTGSNIALWFWGCVAIIFLIWIFGNNGEEITKNTNSERVTTSKSNSPAQESTANQQYSANKSPSPSVSSSESASSAPDLKPSAQRTKEVQQLLTDLSYNPGSVDGAYGFRTSEAVKAFQRDAGIPQNGWIDDNLLDTLRRAKVAYKPLVPQPKPQSHTSLQSHSKTRSASTSTLANYFTRGSHRDEVLRVQGFPDAIRDYSALGYEEWKYGDSFVKISTQDHRVTAWANLGTLKVRLSPGSNITSAKYFTRNSHQDDVLRLQGTPDNINDYSAPGFELWKYGYSLVKLSTLDRRVVDWSNNSGNLMVK